MIPTLLFDFLVDKDLKQITVQKAFAAPLALVWDAFTTQKMLEQWWAPKPYTARTKEMNFAEGGGWHYAMVSPEGEEHWSKNTFDTIVKHQYYQGVDFFCDAEGNKKPEMGVSHWHVSFENQGSETQVNITIRFDDLKDLEMMVSMDFQGGFTMTINYLDTLLATLV